MGPNSVHQTKQLLLRPELRVSAYGPILTSERVLCAKTEINLTE